LSPALLEFGIKPIKSVLATAHKVGSPRDSELKCCVIKGPGTSAIVFRAQTLDPNYLNGSWAEKTFAEAVFSCTPMWAMALDFKQKQLKWFHDNLPKTNPKGYFICMFLIRSEQEIIPKEQIVSVGNHICKNINRDENTTTTITLDEQSFFWLEGKPVWSDVIGYDAALKDLFLKTGHTSGFPDYYVRFKNTIHSYFHAGTFSVELAQALGAPPLKNFTHPCALLPTLMKMILMLLAKSDFHFLQ
jgi:hypothetical protein